MDFYLFSCIIFGEGIILKSKKIVNFPEKLKELYGDERNPDSLSGKVINKFVEYLKEGVSTDNN